VLAVGRVAKAHPARRTWKCPHYLAREVVVDPNQALRLWVSPTRFAIPNHPSGDYSSLRPNAGLAPRRHGFSQIANLDRWDSYPPVRYVFGYEAAPNAVAIARRIRANPPGWRGRGRRGRADSSATLDGRRFPPARRRAVRRDDGAGRGPAGRGDGSGRRQTMPACRCRR
jgi:hypothetical protein